MSVVVLALAGAATALATGLGAVPVFLLGEHTARRLRPFLWGVTVGVMTIAAIVGLLEPAFDAGPAGRVVAGTAAGVAFMLATRRWLERRDVHVGRVRGAGARQSLLVFAVLLVHSVPEGLAIGSAFASDTAGLALFVFLAIAIQNVPEGTTVAIPMASAGFSRSEQFWAAVLTSAPQPVGAVVAYLAVESIGGLLPLSFGFAAGAMLALVVVELVPAALTPGGRLMGLGGAAAGAAVMLALAAAFGV